MKGYVLSRVKGAFALFLLFGDGIKAYSGTRRDALVSFAVPALLLCGALVLIPLYPPRGMGEGFTEGAMRGLVVTSTLAYYFLFGMVVAAYSYLAKSMDKAWLFVEAYNWLAAAAAVITLPLTLAAVNGWLGRDEMDRALIILGLYAFIPVACIANRAYRLNWQLAGALACILLAMDQEAMSFAYWAFDVPYPWDY